MTAELESCTIKELLDLIAQLLAKSSEGRNLMNRSNVDATMKMADSTRRQSGDIKSAAKAQFIGACVGVGIQVVASCVALRGASKSGDIVNKALQNKNETVKNAKVDVGDAGKGPTLSPKAQIAAARDIYKAEVHTANTVNSTYTAYSQFIGIFASVASSGGNWAGASWQADQKIHESEGQTAQALRDMSQSVAQDYDKTLASFLGLVSSVSNFQASQGQGFRV